MLWQHVRYVPVAVELHVTRHLSMRNGIGGFLQTLSLEINADASVRNDEIRIHGALDATRLLAEGERIEVYLSNDLFL